MNKYLVVLLCLAFLAVACADPGERHADAEPHATGSADAADGDDHVEETELPPVDGILLSEIVRTLEDSGYAPIVEIEFEGGVWEVEALHQGAIVEVAIDPMTCERVEDHEREAETP